MTKRARDELIDHIAAMFTPAARYTGHAVIARILGAKCAKCAGTWQKADGATCECARIRRGHEP